MNKLLQILILTGLWDINYFQTKDVENYPLAATHGQLFESSTPPFGW
jgi:hypothetical protein